MKYQIKSYQPIGAEYLKPLLLTSSGGGGHITAIMGLHGFISQMNSSVELPLYNPVLYKDKPDSPLRKQIQRGVRMLYAPAIGAPIQSLLSFTAFPTLPDQKSLEYEIETLSKKEEGTQRPYIDMLLDVYPAGYEYAAIWNIFQRNDKITELKKLIRLQQRADRENEAVVTTYFLNQLKNAAQQHSAYTEIISTQAIGLSGLCNAVLAYNLWLEDKPHLNAPKVIIQQYMTDLPTKGAVHFFKALAGLSHKQQEQMVLYAVGVKKHIIDYFFPHGVYFKDIFDIPIKENPMVRQGLRSAEADFSKYLHKSVVLSLCGARKSYLLKAHEQIASILLGSQVGKDTAQYIDILLQNGIDRVFVFGGTTSVIKADIEHLLCAHPYYKERIIPLSYQSDSKLASLMTRSNFIIIRGGGLSVMEQMVINHHSEQTVLIHHAHGDHGELTSGISWEDDNVDCLISELSGKGVCALKTNPQRAHQDIIQAKLTIAAKQHRNIKNGNYLQYSEIR